MAAEVETFQKYSGYLQSECEYGNGYSPIFLCTGGILEA